MEEELINTTVNDYSSYAKINMETELRKAHIAVDEMLIRLEEFESALGALEDETQETFESALDDIMDCRQEIYILTRRITLLELSLYKISADLSTIEHQVEVAETHIGTPENKLVTLFKPFLNKLSKETGQNSNEPKQENFVYEKPDFFKASDYFKDQAQPE